MDKIEPFSESRNKARTNAGLTGGPFFKNPVVAPARTFVDGVPSEVTTAINSGAPASGKTFDPWVIRRPGK